MSRLLIASVLFCGPLLIPAKVVNAGIIQQSTAAVAIQDVNLLGIGAQLVATGNIDFTFDLGPNGTTANGGGTSDVLARFQGFVPTEFSPLGIAGLPFDLSNDVSVFPINPATVEVTSTGTVNLDSQFGIQIFDPTRTVALATFYTLDTGLFQGIDVGVPVPNGTVFQDPNRPNDALAVFAGPNSFPTPIPEGTPIGVSFNRTVTTVPEPSSMAVFALGSLCCLATRSDRRKKN